MIIFMLHCGSDSPRVGTGSESSEEPEKQKIKITVSSVDKIMINSRNVEGKIVVQDS